MVKATAAAAIRKICKQRFMEASNVNVDSPEVSPRAEL
jgi:hypothetical protein